ncbi:MAG: hypothetical protein LAN62_14935 [Acidobacteriia bacterium]|nr:hypothetical protein [Terriglobia bacterium]
MATSNAAELLIRIGADPSNAEESIGRFRANFSREFATLSADLARWATQGSGQVSTVDRTVQTLASHFNVNVGAVSNLLNRNRQVAELWKADLVATFADVLNSSQALENSLGRSFLLFDTALGVNIANAVIWQRSIGEAFRKAAVGAVSAIAQEAVVRAIYSTALGFYLLAIQDYRGAALAFQSAAMYGAVGGAAAIAGRALAGPDVREAERGSTVRQPGSVAPELIVSGGGGAGATTTEQKTVQVIFQGPVYGGQAGVDELVRHISQAVTERDVNLTAYTVVRQPATRA